MQKAKALGLAPLGAGHVTLGLSFPICNMERVKSILSLFSLGPVISDSALGCQEQHSLLAACRFSSLGN